MSISSGSDVTIPMQDSPPPPPSPYRNAKGRDPDPEAGSSESKVTGIDNKSYNHGPSSLNEDNKKSSSSSKSQTEIPMDEYTEILPGSTCPKVTEAVNTELVNGVNVLDTIPHKPQSEFGPYEKFPEYFISVNQHKKFFTRGEKLSVTKDKRKSSGKVKKYLCWGLGGFLLAAIITVAVLAALGLIPEKAEKGTFSMREMTTSTGNPDDFSSSFGSTQDDLSSTSEFPSSTEFTEKPTDVFANHVPNAADIWLIFKDEKFEDQLEDASSLRFKNLASEIEDLVKEKLENENDIDAATTRLIEFKRGSIVAKLRILWSRDAVGEDAPDFPTIQTVVSSWTKLGNHTLGKGTVAYRLYNLCKTSNNGCSHNCAFDESTLDFVCTCPENKLLDDDKKTCVDVTSGSIPTESETSTETLSTSEPPSQPSESPSSSTPTLPEEPVSEHSLVPSEPSGSPSPFTPQLPEKTATEPSLVPSEPSENPSPFTPQLPEETASEPSSVPSEPSESPSSSAPQLPEEIASEPAVPSTPSEIPVSSAVPPTEDGEPVIISSTTTTTTTTPAPPTEETHPQETEPLSQEEVMPTEAIPPPERVSPSDEPDQVPDDVSSSPNPEILPVPESSPETIINNNSTSSEIEESLPVEPASTPTRKPTTFEPASAEIGDDETSTGEDGNQPMDTTITPMDILDLITPRTTPLSTGENRVTPRQPRLEIDGDNIESGEVNPTNTTTPTTWVPFPDDDFLKEHRENARGVTATTLPDDDLEVNNQLVTEETIAHNGAGRKSSRAYDPLESDVTEINPTETPYSRRPTSHSDEFMVYSDLGNSHGNTSTTIATSVGTSEETSSSKSQEDSREVLSAERAQPEQSSHQNETEPRKSEQLIDENQTQPRRSEQLIEANSEVMRIRGDSFERDREEITTYHPVSLLNDTMVNEMIGNATEDVNSENLPTDLQDSTPNGSAEGVVIEANSSGQSQDLSVEPTGSGSSEGNDQSGASVETKVPARDEFLDTLVHEAHLEISTSAPSVNSTVAPEAVHLSNSVITHAPEISAEMMSEISLKNPAHSESVDDTLAQWLPAEPNESADQNITSEQAENELSS